MVTMVRDYIFLAAGCISLGLVLTFLVLGVCQRLGIDIDENLWVLAIPAVLALLLNITLLEVYRKFRGRRG
jgi:hypothetical protein